VAEQEKSLAEQIDLVVAKRLGHRIYDETRRYLEAARTAVLTEEVVILVGPPRVGKSSVSRQVFGAHSKQAPDEQDHMHSVYVPAGNDSTAGAFSTKAFLSACLNSIRHPLLSTDVAAREGRLGDSFLSRTTEGAMRSAFERCLVARRTQFLVIDEAHHVLNAKGGERSAGAILDSFKVLAARTGVRLVLVGSYDLLTAVNLAPHLIGRSQTIEFPRYRESERDIVEWTRIVRHYSSLIHEDAHAMDEYIEALYDGSWGCIGALSRWIRNALASCRSEGRSIPGQGDWARTRQLSSALAAVNAEIRRGELHFSAKKDVAMPEAAPTLAVRASKKPAPFKRKTRRNEI